MVFTRQGASTSAPPPPARHAEALQPQSEATNPSLLTTMIPQQPAVVTQTPEVATQPGLGIDVAQIIQQAVQASVQATQAIVQETLSAFMQAMAPQITQVQTATTAQPQTQMPAPPQP